MGRIAAAAFWLGLSSLPASADFGSYQMSGTPSAPVISALSCGSVTASGAICTWTTNVAAGTQTCLGSAAGNYTTPGCDANVTVQVTSHTDTLSGLAASTTYHVKAVSLSASSGLTGASYPSPGDYSFTTAAASGACAYGVSPDGCTAGQTEAASQLVVPGPPTANAFTVQHPDFFTSYARQNNQTWGNLSGNTGCVNPNCHPPWNVAGVDYPVGVRSTYAGSLIDPTVSTPAGCHFLYPNVLECNTLGANPTFQGYNFASTTRGCVALDIDSGTGNLLISDNVFGNTANCWPQASYINSNTTYVANVCDVGANFTNVTVQYNYADLNGANAMLGSGNFNRYIGCGLGGTGGSLIYWYNAAINISCDFMMGQIGHLSTKAVMLYNYGEGEAYEYLMGAAEDPSGKCHDHMAWFKSVPGDTIGPTIGDYNTLLNTNTGEGGTALIWFSTGQDDGSVFSNVQANNNTLVANWRWTQPFTGSISAANVLTVTGWTQYGFIGSVNPNNLYGAGLPWPRFVVAAPTSVSGFISGTGGQNGDYNLSNGPGAIAAETMQNGITTQSRLIELGHNGATAVTFTNNFIDGIAVGAKCMALDVTAGATAPAPTASGNIIMLNGASNNSFTGSPSAGWGSGPVC